MPPCRESGGGGFGQEILDRVDLFIVELEVAGGHDSGGLLGVAGADDGSGDGGVAKGPGDGNLADGAVVALGDFAEVIDEREIAGEIGLGEIVMAVTPVIFGKFGGALAGHGTGEQAGGHGRVDDDADIFMQAVGQDVFFHFAMDERIGRLERGYGGDGLGALDLLDVEIGDADPADFAFAFEVGERRPAFFEVG